MYEEHFGFREPPFRITPDPRFLYRNPCVEEAAAALAYGIERRKGFLSLVGEAGTGKTTLLRHVLDTLAGNVRTVVLLHPTVEFDEILEYIMSELGVPIDGARKLVLLQRLNEFLIEHTHAGGNVALIIDEAQDLDARVLEELRLLSNLETGTEKILQIVLAGQPELEMKLADPSLRQLRQRIALHVRLRPLSPEEVGAYIRTRLRLAGAPESDVFTPAASDRIATVSLGIPRVVNVLCDACLVTAYAMNAKHVTPQIVDEAWVDYSRLVGDLPEAPVSSPRVVPTPVAAKSAAPVDLTAAIPPTSRPEESVAAPEEGVAAPAVEPRAVPPRVPPREAQPPASPRVAAAGTPHAGRIVPAPDVVPGPDSVVEPRIEMPSSQEPRWARARPVSIAAVVAIFLAAAFNVLNRGPAPNRDGTPTPETVVAHMPVVTADADPLVTTASPAEARALVHEFQLAYEARDAARVAALFAADGVDNDQRGVEAIRSEYARTFQRLSDVTVTVPQIDSVLHGERLTLTGPIIVGYRDATGERGELRGTAQWEIARLGGTPRILRLHHDVLPRPS
jgi:general secretion pathway protein A